MAITLAQVFATIFFFGAVANTFLVNHVAKYAANFPPRSWPHRILNLLSEVEMVFVVWATLFLIFYTFFYGLVIYDETYRVVGGMLYYLQGVDFSGPTFVFVMMCMAASRPIMVLAEKCLILLATKLPIPEKMSFFLTCMTLGPLLGSLMTEPAAMTLTALLMQKMFFQRGEMSERFRYATLGLLFVNISIAGTLTHFAAPPVVMVAAKWGYTLQSMFFQFGYKAIFALMTSTLAVVFFFRHELRGSLSLQRNEENIPEWIYVVHLIFLIIAVKTANQGVFSLMLLLFFIRFVRYTKDHQWPLRIQDSLMVGLFLAGLMILGSMQDWWVKSLMLKMHDYTIFFGTTFLTAITDNAAVVYLGSLANLTERAKYYLLAGSVVGGGLTLIANAPNLVGYQILRESFAKEGFSALKLFIAALFPTMVALFYFFFFY